MWNGKYSSYIMIALREQLGLREDDTSRDEEIMRMSKKSVVDMYLANEGLFFFTSKLLSMVEDIYDIRLEEK